MKEWLAAMRAIVGLIIVVLPTTGLAETFDIATYCRKVGAAVGGSYQIELGCRQQEEAARTRLSRMQIPERIQSYCTQVAQAVGGSYQIMGGCVEQELEARRKLQ
jgi:hypothetical protein